MTSPKGHRPPRLFDRLLEWYCDERYLEEIQGALYEYFHELSEEGQYRRATWYFALDVLAHCRPHLWKKSKKRQMISFMFANHLKISLRNLWKYRLNTVLNGLGLTLGITLFLLIMIWVRHERSFDSYHENADRIYRISNTFTSESEQFSQALAAPAIGVRLPEAFPTIESGVRIGQSSAQIDIDGHTFYENEIIVVDPTFFEIFDFPILAGSRDNPFPQLNSVVITASAAKKYFGDDDPLGQRMVADGADNLVVGAVVADAPPNSQIQYSMIIQMDLLKEMYGMDNMDDEWGGGWFQTYLLLQGGTDVKELEKRINAHVLPHLEWFTEKNMSYVHFLQPLTSIHLNSHLRYDFGSNGSARNVLIFIAVAIIILSLACINYINLSTATAINRAKEVGIKKVIGAPTRTLFLQHLTETLLLLTGSAALSLVLFFASIPYLERFLEQTLVQPPVATTIIFTLVGVLLLGLVTGLVPAAIISAFQPLVVLKGAVKRGRSGQLVRRVLVVVQFAASIILMLAIITVQQQMRHIAKKDLGMTIDEVIHISFRGVESVSEKGEVLTAELLKHPAIKSVSFQNGGYPVNGLSNGMVMVEKDDGSRVSSSLYHMWVDEQFVETFGIEMAAGRFFSKDFPIDSTRSVVVNESAVKNFGWQDAQAAIGKEMGNGDDIRRVIGVTKDFHFEGLQKSVEPVRILPIDDSGPTTLAIRADLHDPLEVLKHVEQAWTLVNPTVALDATFMNEDVQQQYQAELMFRSLFMLFSPLSLIIACLGLFGLASASTQQRVKEVGIRKVLGASQASILSLLNKEFLILIVVSLVVATPVAWWSMQRWLENFQYRIDFQWYFVVIAGALALGLALSVASLKAVNVARTNPARSLRTE